MKGTGQVLGLQRRKLFGGDTGHPLLGRAGEFAVEIAFIRALPHERIGLHVGLEKALGLLFGVPDKDMPDHRA